MSNPSDTDIEAAAKEPRALLLAALASSEPYGRIARQTAARFLMGLPVQERTGKALSIAMPEAYRIRPQWYPEWQKADGS